MKKSFTFLVLFSLVIIMAVAQKNNNAWVNIILKNKSVLPKKCTIISYTLGDAGNGTQAYWLLPGGTKTLKFKEGTKLYIANQKQVDTVMSGKRIDNGEPFLIVKKEDNNQIFKL